MSRPGFLRRILLPGFVFQSVVIAGGYGTGRELAEFFLMEGPVGGLLAIPSPPSSGAWSAPSPTSWRESPRPSTIGPSFRGFLGPGWVVYEVAYLVFMLLILAVIAAASGSLLEETFGLPYWVGVVGIMVAVGTLVLGGSSTIEKVMAGWSFVLYAAYIVFFFWCFQQLRGSDPGGVRGDRPEGFLGGCRCPICCLQHRSHSRHSLPCPPPYESKRDLPRGSPGGPDRHDPGPSLLPGHGWPIPGDPRSPGPGELPPGTPGFPLVPDRISGWCFSERSSKPVPV